jgi:hypothetical protein
MKKIIFLFFIACLFNSCNKLIDFIPGRGHTSSEFKKVYGGTGQDEVLSVLVTSDGGISWVQIIKVPTEMLRGIKVIRMPGQ